MKRKRIKQPRLFFLSGLQISSFTKLTNCYVLSLAKSAVLNGYKENNNTNRPRRTDQPVLQPV